MCKSASFNLLASTMASQSFILTAGPGSDIWRKPPSTNVFNASTCPPAHTATARGRLSSFRSARLSFAFLWKEQCDQAGLLLTLRPASSGAHVADAKPPKWIKTGVEYYHGSPMLSTVACDAWADWSVTPLLKGEGAGAGGKEWITVSVVREGDNTGVSAWVYQVVPGVDGTEAKVPLREICWVFEDRPEEWELTVEAMAARPTKGTEEALSVEFTGFDVVWK